MDIFVRNYQPELYEKWTLGQDRDRHPEAQYEDVLHPQLVSQFTCSNRLIGYFYIYLCV